MARNGGGEENGQRNQVTRNGCRAMAAARRTERGFAFANLKTWRAIGISRRRYGAVL
jgi:hypothetical protein